MLLRIYVAFVLVLPVGSVALAAEAPAQPPLRFAAGESGGPYHQLATALSEALATGPRPLAVEVLTSTGSYANADLLRDGGAELALLQSDVAYTEYLRDQPFFALAALGSEPIHLLVLRELGASDSSDLSRVTDRPVRVAIGAKGSGTTANALAVLAELEPPPHGFVQRQMGTEEALRELAARRVDAAFLTASAPAPQILDAAPDLRLAEAAVLLDLDRDTRSRLSRRFPFLHVTEIAVDTYPMLDHRVTTLGTRTLLVARTDTDEATVERILTALYALAAKSLSDRPRSLQEFSAANAMNDLSIPLLPAAESFHLDRRVWNGNLRMRVRAVLLVAGLLAMLVLLAVNFARLAYFFERFRLLSLVAALALVWLIGAETMYLLEGSGNAHFGSFGRSALAILYYLFSGLESRYPYTRQGTALAIVILSLGVTVVAAITATIASRFVEITLNVRTLRIKPFRRLKLRDHVVIAGWSPRTQRILRQLRSPDLRHPPAVVVITPDVDRTRVECRSEYSHTWVVEGNASQRETLLRADVDTARAVLVLAEQVNDAAGDLLTIATTAAIEHLHRDVHTIVAIGHRRFREHLDYSLADEVVVHEALTEGFLSQCVINPGVLSVYDELLSFGRGSQEIYFAPLPEWLAGQTFRHALRVLDGQPLIPIGYCLGAGAPVLNPAPDSPLPRLATGTDEPNPRLIFVADGVEALPRQPPRREVAPVAAPETDPSADDEARDANRSFRVGICGWNSALPWLLGELCGNELWQERLAEVVVVGTFDYPDQGKLSADPRVRHVSGNPASRDVLLAAGIERLDRLVVLSRVPEGTPNDDSATRRADHEALIVCQAARSAAPEIHIVAEVLDPRHREVFHHLAPIEIVSVADLSEKLLAQAVINPGITHAFLELLTATATSSELYLTPVPPTRIGSSYAALCHEVASSPEREIVLGFRGETADGRHTRLNPGATDRQRRLRADDQVIVLAARPPRWS